MSNILYVAPYRQNDGWGAASKDYLRSLAYATNKLGHNLQARPIFLSNSVDRVLEDDLKTYEEKSLSNIDIIIQKALPQAICPIYPYKNIAFCVFEQTNLAHSAYIKQIFNRMDHVCVPSLLEQKTLHDSGVKTPIHSVSQPINTKEINIIESSINNDSMDMLSLSSKYKDFTKFYFIGSFIPRKNIINLILAFNYEFQSREKALLVIKTDKMDNSRREAIISGVNETIGRNKYNRTLTPNLILIADNLDRNNLIRLHHSCDIFVCPSKGEAFCRPLAEALCLGKYPIAVENTGASELIDTNIAGLIIPSRLEISEANPANIRLDHECELELSAEPTILDIRQTLRHAFNHHQNLSTNERNKLSENIKAYSNKFSIASIGEQLCSLDIM